MIPNGIISPCVTICPPESHLATKLVQRLTKINQSISTRTKKWLDQLEVNIVTTDRKCEICGALSKPVDNFVYDAEYSYDDYYQTDSVKVCPYILKLECIDCHKKKHSSDIAKE